MKPLSAGRLRHRIRIERPTLVQDAYGAGTTTWETVANDIYAAIEPLSANAFIAAQTLKSKISVRIVIRYRPGLNTSMRLIGADGTIYVPAGFLPDPDSGREYITIPASITT